MVTLPRDFDVEFYDGQTCVEVDEVEGFQDDTVTEFGVKLKCGEILLMQNEWRIVFKCEVCHSESSSLDGFLRHSLGHYLDIAAEGIMDLVRQAVLRDHTEKPEESANEAEVAGESTGGPATEESVRIEFLESPSAVWGNDHVEEQYERNDSEAETVLEEKDDDFDECPEQTTDFGCTIERLVVETTEDCDNSQQSTNSGLSTASGDAEAHDELELAATYTPRTSETGVAMYTCEICEASFRWRDRFLLHMRRHNGQKPYKCEFCGACFADTSNFYTHRKRHLGIKPHVCQFCQKGFTATTDLTRHLRTHTGERPYSCDQCDRRFKTTALLNVHRRRHTDTRPFVCSTCGKGFFEAYHLKDHEISHSKEKRFACTQCDSKFARQKALTQHVKLHSAIKEYKCGQCGKEFSQKSGLLTHEKTHMR